MEDILFNRKYSLIIGRSSELIRRTYPGFLINPSGYLIRTAGFESTPSPAGAGSTLPDGTYIDFIVKPGGAITLTDLRITADIKSTKEGKSNKQGSTIKIYNLSETNRDNIKAEDTVILRAGYDSDGEIPPLIFIGQVKRVSSVKQGQDTITKLLCTASEVPRKNINISKPAVRNETNRDIVNYFSRIAADNGIPTGRVFVADTIRYPSGLPMTGNLFAKMEEYCDRLNLRCYVTLGRLYIEPEVGVPATVRVEIEPVNIKDSIRLEDDSTSKPSSDPSKGIGIVFDTFLNGNITLDSVVNIRFGDYRGEYDVTSLEHKIDLEGQDWNTVVSCRRRL